MIAEMIVNSFEVILDDQPLGNAKFITVFLDCLTGLVKEVGAASHQFQIGPG